jgi:MFS family permease
LGLAIAGPISDWLGVQVWFIIGGLVCVLGSVVMLLTPAVMHLESHGHAVQAARDAQSLD